jgi:hypothetical protein
MKMIIVILTFFSLRMHAQISAYDSLVQRYGEPRRSTVAFDTAAYISQVEVDLALLLRPQRDMMDKLDSLYLDSILNDCNEIKSYEYKILQKLQILTENPDNTYPVIYHTLSTIFKNNKSDFVLKYFLLMAHKVVRPNITGIGDSFQIGKYINYPIHNIVRNNANVFQQYLIRSDYLKSKLDENELVIIHFLLHRYFYLGKFDNRPYADKYIADFIHPVNIEKLILLSKKQ